MAAGSTRFFHSVSSNGSRVRASLRSRAGSNWNEFVGNSRQLACALLKWSAVFMSWRGSLLKPSSKWFSRMRRWEVTGPVALHKHFFG